MTDKQGTLLCHSHPAFNTALGFLQDTHDDFSVKQVCFSLNTASDSKRSHLHANSNRYTEQCCTSVRGVQ